jgi:hypothetical protein
MVRPAQKETIDHEEVRLAEYEFSINVFQNTCARNPPHHFIWQFQIYQLRWLDSLSNKRKNLQPRQAMPLPDVEEVQWTAEVHEERHWGNMICGKPNIYQVETYLQESKEEIQHQK